MTGRKRQAVALLTAAIALAGSCGKTPPPLDATHTAAPSATSPTAATQLTISTRCLGPFRPGNYYGLACHVDVQDTTQPAKNAFSARADLRIFGGGAEVAFPQCPACGGPPATFDLDLQIPADMTPGVKRFAVWATDLEGHRADTTASIEIVAR